MAPLLRAAGSRALCLPVLSLALPLYLQAFQAAAHAEPRKAPIRLAQAIDAGGMYGEVLPVPDKPPLGYNAGRQGAFIVSLVRDRFGGVWAGTEDQGVWHYDPSALEKDRWRQFTTKDGLGDNHAYALTVDALGRVWVGHASRGVSVWNGQEWRTYGVLEGPIGERIFAMAVSPNDGDVWMATSAGLSRYSLSQNLWKHYTRAHGLPSHLATCLAFDRNGTLFVGTATDGLAISYSDTDYQKWQTVKGPHALPRRDRGEGLPGSMISDLLSAPDGTVYAATTRGLARTRDGGETWTYLRGVDWKEKLGGLLKPVEPEAEGNSTQLLREDYISCLSMDERGLLWIGYRQRGYEVRDPGRDRVLYTSASNEKKEFPYVSAILPFPGAGPLLGTYNQGLQEAVSFSAPRPQGATEGPVTTPADGRGWNGQAVAPLPRPAEAPGLADLQGMLKAVQAAQEAGAGEEKMPLVVPLEDDWSTQGDWLGRYGRHWACLGAFSSPRDYQWGAGALPVAYDARIGPNAKKGDSIRRWVHRVYTDDRRSLEMPTPYFHSRLQRKMTVPSKGRRQAEMDDHGEEYPMSKDGPHLYFSLQVPNGLHTLSLYDFNKDGHDGFNRMRDYRVSVRPLDAKKHLGDLSTFADAPELASGRIRDFWGGVWKRYLVRGPQKLIVEVSRNYSYNTILAGVFLDTLEEKPTPYFFKQVEASTALVPERTETSAKARAGGKKPLTGTGKGTVVEAVANEAAMEPQQTEEGPSVAVRILEGLEGLQKSNPTWWARSSRPHYLALVRWLGQARQSTPPQGMARLEQQIGTACYRLQMFEEWEKSLSRQGLTPAREIEKGLRWDSKAPSLSGRGRQTVMAHMAAHTDDLGTYYFGGRPRGKTAPATGNSSVKPE